MQYHFFVTFGVKKSCFVSMDMKHGTCFLPII